MPSFAEDRDMRTSDERMAELNTLSVIFNSPTSLFIAAEFQVVSFSYSMLYVH
jgi:hypothetical protein